MNYLRCLYREGDTGNIRGTYCSNPLSLCHLIPTGNNDFEWWTTFYPCGLFPLNRTCGKNSVVNRDLLPVLPRGSHVEVKMPLLLRFFGVER